MQLSRNFSLLELTKSDTAIRKGIDNNPNADQIEKLKLLCENILQPVRDHFGRVKVTSGFRSVELCTAIGSSAKSQHAKAEAADFEVVGTEITLNFLIGLNLTFNQISLSLSFIHQVNLTLVGYIVVGYLKVDVHHSYTHIDQKVKLNTNLY